MIRNMCQELAKNFSGINDQQVAVHTRQVDMHAAVQHIVEHCQHMYQAVSAQRESLIHLQEQTTGYQGDMTTSKMETSAIIE